MLGNLLVAFFDPVGLLSIVVSVLPFQCDGKTLGPLRLRLAGKHEFSASHRQLKKHGLLKLALLHQFTGHWGQTSVIERIPI